MFVWLCRCSCTRSCLMTAIRTAALENGRWIRATSLPEILTLDAKRVRSMRDAVRRAAIAVSLGVVAGLPVASQLALCSNLEACPLQAESVAGVAHGVEAAVVAAAMKSSKGSVRCIVTGRFAEALHVGAQGGDFAAALREQRLHAFAEHLSPFVTSAQNLIENIAIVYEPIISLLLSTTTR